MELSVSNLMMLFFLFALSTSLWKVYPFLQTKTLKDDDRTDEALSQLKELMLKIIKENNADLKREELFLKMKEDKDFDSKLFWRFNQNRLNHLIKAHDMDHLTEK